LLLYSSHLPLGVPNGLVIQLGTSYFLAPSTSNQALFWRRCQGGSRRPLQGEFFAHTSFTLLLVLLYFTLFLLASFFIENPKNRILDSCFYLFAFSFAKMSNPEVEVHSFKQQGRESLKDAWYLINNAHHRSTKKHSTTILLRNFYVGISSWSRHVLDTLTGGNFLGTPAGEACTIIKSLVGIPPIHDVKLRSPWRRC
jgi:hypothetical protein